MKQLTKKKAISMLPISFSVKVMTQFQHGSLDFQARSKEYIISKINLNPVYLSGKTATRLGFGLAIRDQDGSYLWVQTARKY
jgi:hypothetical protein